MQEPLTPTTLLGSVMVHVWETTPEEQNSVSFHICDDDDDDDDGERDNQLKWFNSYHLLNSIPATVSDLFSSARSCTRRKLQHHLCRGWGSATQDVCLMRNMRSTDLAPEVWTQQRPAGSHPLERDEITGRTGPLKRGTAKETDYIET